MEKDEENNNGDLTQLIIKTAIRTFLSAVVCIILAVSLAVTFLPYQAMKVYSDLGMKVRSLECAERYIDSQSSKYGENNNPPIDGRYVSAVYMADELSISLFTTADDSQAVDYYAQKILRHSQNYLSINSIHERNELINAYNVANQPYYYHTSLYSYRDYLCRYNYLARCVLDERDEMLLNGSVDTVSMVTSRFLNENLNLTLNNIDSFAEIFNQLSEMIRYDFKQAGITDISSMNESQLGAVRLDAYISYFHPLISRDKSAGLDTNFTLLLRSVESKFEQLKSFALTMPCANAEEALQQLYVFRSLSYFAENLNKALIILSGNEHYAHININDALRWQTLGTVSVNERNYTMTDYYNTVLMPQYTRILAAR